jgi:hypothetical protein
VVVMVVVVVMGRLKQKVAVIPKQKKAPARSPLCAKGYPNPEVGRSGVNGWGAFGLALVYLFSPRIFHDFGFGKWKWRKRLRSLSLLFFPL